MLRHRRTGKKRRIQASQLELTRAAHLANPSLQCRYSQIEHLDRQLLQHSPGPSLDL